eukprot:Ihof_evm6s31 gene=Ihof_evmTU6s31
MSSVTSAPYGVTPQDETIQIHTLKNKRGTVVKVIDYGATISHIILTDNNGVKRDVVLGFDTLEGWMSKKNPCFNAVPGRVANRIARGKFSLDGKNYKLAINNEKNHLHGGPTGFHKRIWECVDTSLDEEGNAYVVLRYVSKDGEEGYPGTVTVMVTYTLAHNADTLTCRFIAITDQATPINLTNHCYFNLSGMASPNILKNIAYINANKYAQVEKDLIPTGKLVNVKETAAMSFLEPTEIGKRIDQTTEGKGYDHSYHLNTHGDTSILAAKFSDPMSNISLELYTNRPAVQLYCANWLDGTIPVKNTQKELA